MQLSCLVIIIKVPFSHSSPHEWGGQPASSQGDPRGSLGRGHAYVLIGSNEEAVVDISLHQAGLAHVLLPQHYYFDIHTLPTHSPATASLGPSQELPSGACRWIPGPLRELTLPALAREPASARAPYAAKERKSQAENFTCSKETPRKG